MHQWWTDRHTRVRRRNWYQYSRVWIPAALSVILGLALIPVLARAPSSATSTAASVKSTVVSLNFDDDSASQYYLGFEKALQPAGVHATFYIHSGAMGTDGKLSWPQISSLAAAGDEIGDEAAAGAQLTSLSAQQQVGEICDDRQNVISQGITPVTFAYPADTASTTVQADVQECGYGNARTAGGLSPAGPVYADTLPPRNWLTLRAYAPGGRVTLASLESLVSKAASHGGGWLPISIKRVCSAALDKANYRSCTSSVGWVDLGNLQTFISWVQNAGQPGRAPAGTVFRTMGAAAKSADTVAPSTAISCNGSPCQSSTYGGTVNVAFSPTDRGSGAASTHYSLDGSTPTQSSPTYTRPIPLTATTTVKYRSWDYAGNADAVHTKTILIITGQLNAEQISGKTIISLTFDDQYEDQWLYAAPLMRAHYFTGTYYVITTDTDHGFKCCMTWSQLDTLLAQGNDIGSHTISHPDNLTKLTMSQVKQEVCDSKQDLIIHGIPDPESFAYPDGIYNAKVRSIVKQCGFDNARQGGGISQGTTTPAPPYVETIPPRDPLALRTIAVDGAADEKLADMKAYVNAAAANGGGWLPITIHDVCDAKAADFSACMAKFGSIQDTVVGQFLEWLAAAGLPGGAPAGVIVKNVCQVMHCP